MKGFLMKLTFPEGFLWGSATAAHQVEGNNTNSDWWQWENSEQRIRELKKQKKNPEEFKSGIACDSYNRYEQDFDIAKSLNQNAHRLSIEWARIEPEVGKFDLEQIEHYRKVLKALRERGLKTFVTLHHFTNPIWFAEMGGWEKSENIHYFARYAEVVLSDLSNLIDFVQVINEPDTYAAVSYLKGYWPPKQKKFSTAVAVLNNMAMAQKWIYDFAKQKRINSKVGCSIIINPIVGPLGIGAPLTKMLYGWILKKFANSSDFIGVQYYTRYSFWIKKLATNDFGWEIYPRGIYNVLKLCAKFNKPIYISENGIADAKDKMRKNYIHDHLKFVHQAISEGIDVKGYLHWSLLDNFEWAEGYTQKFGLVEIDRKNNLQRKVRKSAEYYAQICKNNYIET